MSDISNNVMTGIALNGFNKLLLTYSCYIAQSRGTKTKRQFENHPKPKNNNSHPKQPTLQSNIFVQHITKRENIVDQKKSEFMSKPNFFQYSALSLTEIWIKQ